MAELKAVDSFSQSKFQYDLFDHQIEAARKIVKSYSAGKRGFLLADKTGLGKTLSALSGISSTARYAGYGQGRKRKARTLIVCPSGAIPVWAETIEGFFSSTKYLSPVITNYEQMHKLLRAPASAQRAKKARTRKKNTAAHGTPIHDWDFVLFDESHKLKNYPKSLVSNAAASVSKLNSRYEKGKSPFVMFITATPGATPDNLAIMAGIIGPLINPSVKDVYPKEWMSFLSKNGFSIVKTKKSGLQWISAPWFGKNSSDPEVRENFRKKEQEVKTKRRKDILLLQRALKRRDAPFLVRTPSQIKGWPEQQVVMLPINLNSRQKPLYEEMWSTFRQQFMLSAAKRDSQSALVQALRYSQKSSLLKVEAMRPFIMENLEAGHQIYVSCQFMDTIKEYEKLLDSMNVKYSEITGRTKDRHKEEKYKFQKGETKVVLCTVIEAISLHANELLPDGTKATSNPRISIIHDVRRNPLDADQSFGRAHRNGENSVIYIPFFKDTADRTMVSSLAERRGNMKTMLSEDDAWDMMNRIESILSEE